MLRRSAFVLVALALLLGLAVGAQAATCPNEAVRLQQGSTGLPDCRAYELVSQPELNGSLIVGSSGISADGRRVAYHIISGGVPGSTSGGGSNLLATRSSNGWESRSLEPPRSEMNGDAFLVMALTPNLDAQAMWAFEGPFAASQDSLGVSLVRLDADGRPTLLHTFPAGFGFAPLVVASDDLSHVFIRVPAGSDPLLPGYTAENLFDAGGVTPQLVDRLPGSNEPPSCGLRGGRRGFIGGSETPASHWASSDGSHVFFATSGNECAGPLELYVRDISAHITTLVSGAVLPGDEDRGVNQFLQAAADGSWVIYRTASSLDPADDAEGGSSEDMDIYRYDLATHVNTCLTCAMRGASVSAGLAPAERGAAVSEDGSHVYFTAAGQYGGAPSEGSEAAPNLYVWHTVDGQPRIDFIAQVDRAGVTYLPSSGGEVTPDGDVLVFKSGQADLDALTGTENGGTFQYYRYEDGAHQLTCVSCPAGRAATREVEDGLADAHIGGAVAPLAGGVSDDGRTIAFMTAEALVPGDVDQGPDIYEWRDGTRTLITSGVAQYRGSLFPLIMSLSADGQDLIFEDLAKLSPDAPVDLEKIYDARIGGGFAAPPPTVACAGEECQGQASSAPAFAQLGSATVLGAGNLGPRTSTPAAKRKPAVKKRKPAAKKHKKHRRRKPRGKRSRAVVVNRRSR